MSAADPRELAARPAVVCLCGSTRFRDAYREAFYREEHAGRICLTVPCYKDDPCCKTPADHARLDALHRHKIDLADSVLVLNVGGYLGTSTLGEVRYARAAGKGVRWLEEGWFWSQVLLADKKECWEWGGPRLPAGYGLCRDSAGGGYAHRFAFEHTTGVAAGEMFVLHECDNPCCVNPDHLHLGTQADNVREMWARGRGKVPESKGQQNGRAKLSEEDVEAIRRRYAAGGVSYRQLAAEYGVDHSLIGYVVKGKLWKS